MGVNFYFLAFSCANEKGTIPTTSFGSNVFDRDIFNVQYVAGI